MDFDDMPVGREMDTLIAKWMSLDVLGTAPCIYHYGWYVSCDSHGEIQPVYLTDCLCDVREDDDIEILGHIAGCLEVVPFYSTDIVSAWKVVEKLGEMDYIVSVCWGPGWDGQCYASVQIQQSMFLVADLVLNNPRAMDGKARTVPLAICRAALKVASRMVAVK